jgi:hypothetical protein
MWDHKQYLKNKDAVLQFNWRLISLIIITWLHYRLEYSFGFISMWLEIFQKNKNNIQWAYSNSFSFSLLWRIFSPLWIWLEYCRHKGLNDVSSCSWTSEPKRLYRSLCRQHCGWSSRPSTRYPVWSFLGTVVHRLTELLPNHCQHRGNHHHKYIFK